MNSKSLALNITSWVFGLFFFAIGLVNMFWGNDPFFGIFIALLSLIYFPLVDIVNPFLKKWTGFSINAIVKIVVGIFILWAALGVGELFAKIDLMKMDLHLH